jgi:3',5'-cyclic AMP phosphodiesterase CpdA
MTNPIGWIQRITLVAGGVLIAMLLSGCAHLVPKPFSFVQMCDPQLGFESYEADLARLEQAVKQINASQADFVVVCGDLVNKPDDKSFGDFNAVRTKLRVPAYCAAGNHDIGNEPTLETLTQFRQKVGKDFFYFDHKGCRFIVLNTQLWKTPVTGETEEQDAWLRKTLVEASRKGRRVFVVVHYPPFVKDPEEADAYFNLPLEKRRELLSDFERAGVVAILAGHTHTTAVNRVGTIEVVTSETTSKNFDKRPFGFRVWHVNADGSYTHEFVPLKGPR